MTKARRKTRRVEETPSIEWEPHRPPKGGILRIRATSCCGAYELASLGGQYFVLRPTSDGGHEETGRGMYAHAAKVFITLASEHWCAADQPLII
ncbi:hypothetical protein HII36_40050 [Nonomuraea sp. NN258]|uniref:hypothetical protein n=1 Tax=Nonomuraea antri TaxID=2730852 RepID=UPI00156A3DF2|nr:hypothetical protein [Nonomuraea antri]NRQ37981.1 hypothetical protein [Nonomuraea antri]